MRMKIDTAVAAREPLAAEIAEHLATLEAVVTAYRKDHADDPSIAALRDAVYPLIELATTLRAEYARYAERFTPLLDRVAALDLDVLKHFPGFPQVRPLPRRAREIRRALTAALEDLDDLLAQAAAVTRDQQATAPLTEWRNMVARLEMDLYRLPSDLKFLLARLGNFGSAQPGPPGHDLHGPVIHV